MLSKTSRRNGGGICGQGYIWDLSQHIVGDSKEDVEVEGLCLSGRRPKFGCACTVTSYSRGAYYKRKSARWKKSVVLERSPLKLVYRSSRTLAEELEEGCYCIAVWNNMAA